MVRPAIWTMMLLKLSAVKKFVALKLKKTTMSTRPMTIGRMPRLPDLTLSRIRSPRLLGASSVARPAAASWPTTSTCASVVIPQAPWPCRRCRRLSWERLP